MARRVFISSVMRDFTAERTAVKEAITRLRLLPVMAEDFGAQPFSSQLACLEGVRSSDIYVGIFGERYGYVAPTSGLGATEEEFQEARKRGMDILCFEKNGMKDAQQAAFLQKVKAYETGYSFAFFSTLDELKMEIVQAINDVIGNPGVSTLDAKTAAAALDRLSWGSVRPNQGGTWLGAVLVPSRQGEAYLDILDFGRKELRDRILQPAIFGSGTLFSLEQATTTAEENDALVFSQESSRQRVAKLETHANGALIYGTLVGANSRQDAMGYSMARLYIIDENEFEQKLTAFLSYAEQYYKGLPRNEMLSSFYLGVSLSGIDNKTFGKLPAHPITTFSMPMHNLPNPLKIPPAPLHISRAELSDAPSLAHKLTEHTARLFRTAKAYYCT